MLGDQYLDDRVLDDDRWSCEGQSEAGATPNSSMTDGVAHNALQTRRGETESIFGIV